MKVQLGRNTDVKAKDAAAELAAATGATVVQVIGKTATLYRENPELPRKHGDPPRGGPNLRHPEPSGACPEERQRRREGRDHPVEGPFRDDRDPSPVGSG